MKRGALTFALVAAALAVASPAASAAPKFPGCAETDVPGGEWRHFGQDLSNSRVQPREKSIAPADVPLLTTAWSFSTTSAEGVQGDFTGTPIVADGCVYAATNRGWAIALNADTGKLVWKRKFPQGGSANNSVGVADRVCGEVVTYKKKTVKRRVRGKIRKKKVKKKVVKPKYCATIFIGATRTRDASKEDGCPEGQRCIGPYAIALDQATGKVEWFTPPLDTQTGADLYGSPVIFDGVMMLGTSGGSAELGDEADRYAFQGSMNFLDTGTGKVLEKTWTIHPPQQPDDDFAGAGVWSTPAVDADGKVAYAGTANPFKPQDEHKYANSILKYDLDKKSKSFGEIIGHYKGLIDEYVPGLSQIPCYDIPGNPAPYYPQGIGQCGDLDLDFGASPNLWKGPDGRTMVGAGQKSGVYHAVDASTMKGEWTQIVGPPSAVGGIVGSTANDGGAVYGPVTAPGYLWSVSATGGAHRWFAPIGDGAHWGNPVAVANGVVYSLDLSGALNAFDARTGMPLNRKSLIPGGTKSPTSLSWGGVAIARNHIYANTGMGSLSEGHIVALKPGAPQDVAEDLTDIAPGGGGGGGGDGGGGGESAAGAAIVAVPGSTYSTYATPVMVTNVGGPLSFVNFDLPQHDVVADEKGPDGRALFQSKLSGLGEIAPIEGLDNVKSGSTYGFFCSLHPGMRGSLIVR